MTTPHEAAQPAARRDEPRREQQQQQQRRAPQELSERQKSSLWFLQLNTPLSMLFVVAVAAFGVLVTPSMELVLRQHQTYLTPSPYMFMVYMCILFFAQIGFCMLSLIARTRHTQLVIVQSTGSRLAICNYLLSLWLLCRIFDTPRMHWFAAVYVGVIAFLSLVDLIVLGCKYSATLRHPFELFFVHVPNKLMMLVVVQVLLGQQLLIVMDAKRENFIDHIAKGFWPTAAIQSVVGVWLAIWIGRSCDVFAYFASIYLDCAVLGFNRVPIIGPRSRPLALTLLLIISMVVRTAALVVPAFLGENCITHRHRQLMHPEEQEALEQAHEPNEPRNQDPHTVTSEQTGEQQPLLRSTTDEPYAQNAADDHADHQYGAVEHSR